MPKDTINRAQPNDRADRQFADQLVNGLTSDQFRALGTGRITALTTAQAAALTTGQLSLLSSDQFAALSTQDLTALKSQQLTALTTALTRYADSHHQPAMPAPDLRPQPWFGLPPR